MDLSPEVVRAITGAVGTRPAEGAGSPSDSRRDPRVRLAGHAIIIPYPVRTGRRPVRVAVHDVSARGIGFEHSAQLFAGEWFILHLPRAEGCPRALLCAVMHCRLTAKGSFLLGASFVCAVQPRDAHTRRQAPVIPTDVLAPAFTLHGPDPADPEVQELKELLALGGLPSNTDAA